MKQVVRYNTFETNSSSTHSLVICSRDEYDGLVSGQYLLQNESKVVDNTLPVKDILDGYAYDHYVEYCTANGVDPDDTNYLFKHIDELNSEYVVDSYELCTLSSFFEQHEFLEDFQDSYTTKSGEEIVVFGVYGYDG